jgi:hypothetical protein
VFTLSPVSAARSLKDRPSISWAIKRTVARPATVQRRFELVQQDPRAYAASGLAVRRGQQILEAHRLPVDLPRRLTCRAVVSSGPESVDDAIPGDADQPRTNLLNRAHHPRRLDQFEQHVLQDVLRVREVAHPPLNKALKANGLARDDLRDVPVLFEGVRQ